MQFKFHARQLNMKIHRIIRVNNVYVIDNGIKTGLRMYIIKIMYHKGKI